MAQEHTGDVRAGHLVGSVIADRYQIRSPVGSGAMSTVYVAWHLRLRYHVAVKVLHPALASADDYVERFEREARSLARLDHPNCLRVLDYGVTDDDLHFMVTELVRGVELRELMSAPVGDPWVAVQRMQQVLAGLEHAHACGVIHRDLKPENILVTQGAGGEELLKIVDFGIAKVVGALPGSGLTAIGAIFGTPQYMSPEQATGRAIDYRSDLYAAGVLLYAMLAGRLPFDDEDPGVVLERQIHDRPPPLPASVPPRLAEITLRLMDKDPERRYPSAAEASRALDDAQWGDVERELHASSATQRRRRRWRTLASLAAASVAVVAVVLAGPLEDAPLRPTDSLGHMTLADADRLLADGQHDRAHEVLSTLLDEHPHDPELLWRDGQALAGAGDVARALARYADALAQDEILVEDPRFSSALRALLRRPELEATAIDLSVQRLHGAGDGFLLEAVNRRSRPLDYVARHRVLEHLRASALVDRIDERLNARLDLAQAASAPNPCLAYLHAVQALEHERELDDLELLRAVVVPQREVPTTECVDAEIRRDALIAALEAEAPGAKRSAS
jgi:hypothetical protein